MIKRLHLKFVWLIECHYPRLLTYQIQFKLQHQSILSDKWIQSLILKLNPPFTDQFKHQPILSDQNKKYFDV